MMAGVLKEDEGEILIDGEAVWDCVEAKQKFFYISDEQYFFPNATPLDMAAFIRRCILRSMRRDFVSFW